MCVAAYIAFVYCYDCTTKYGGAESPPLFEKSVCMRRCVGSRFARYVRTSSGIPLVDWAFIMVSDGLADFVLYDA